MTDEIIVSIILPKCKLLFRLNEEILEVPIEDLDMIKAQEEICTLTYYFPTSEDKSSDIKDSPRDDIPFPILNIENNSVRYFVQILNNINSDVEPNFDHLISLCNYFCASKTITEKLYNYSLKEFSLPVSIVTAYTLNKIFSKSDISGVMTCELIPLKRRLQFMIAHDSGNEWSPNTSIIDNVDKVLNIPKELLRLLNKETCVIAGGAALYLGCPWTKWNLRCDVDFFVFNVENAYELINNLLDILLINKYTLCLSSASVITAIGVYGIRKIQIIRSAAKTVDGLIDDINGFDFNCVKTYYDGQKLYKTIFAEYDWLTRKISGGCYRDILPIRLYGIFWKGFEIDNNSIEYLKNTLGWPIPQKVSSDFENDIPCINPNIPDEVQYVQLEKMHLPVIRDLNKTILELECKSNTYGTVGTFIGSYDEYVNTLKISSGNKLSYRSNEESIVYPGVFYPIFSTYLIRIPLSSNMFSCKMIDTDKRNTLKKLQINDSKEYFQFREMEEKILKLVKETVSPLEIRGLCNNNGEIIQRYYDIKVMCTKSTKLYINGIKVSSDTQIPSRSRISAIAYPKNIYDKIDDSRRSRMRKEHWNNPDICSSFVSWKLVKIFINRYE